MEPKGKREESSDVSLHKLRLLEELEEEPEVRQMDLAVRLGVATGTVNWHLKRLAAKGYVKVKKIGKWRWSYLLTPKGMAEKARVTRAYVQQSMQLYWETKKKAQDLLREVKQAGYKQVRIEGDNDLVDVCRLTCMEQGVAVVSLGESGEPRTTNHDNVPVLRIDGRELSLKWPKEGNG